MLLLQNVRLFGTRLIEIGMSIMNAVVNGQIETKRETMRYNLITQELFKETNSNLQSASIVCCCQRHYYQIFATESVVLSLLCKLINISLGSPRDNGPIRSIIALARTKITRDLTREKSKKIYFI